MRVDHRTLDLLPDPTVVVGADGTVLAANRLAARLTGVGSPGLAGRPAAEALPLVDGMDQSWWQTARPLDRDPRVAPRIPETDLVLRVHHARPRPVLLTAARCPGDHPDDLVLVVSLRRAERRRRLDATRSDLVSTVSHELRSPLTSVKGFTKTLLANWGRFSDLQKQHMLRTVNEDADRVTRLLGELLDVSRIDAGRLPLRRLMVDVPAVVDRVLARVGLQADGRPVVNGLPADLPQLYADPDKLEQVFTNLVENALKYGAGVVRIDASVHPDAVEFVVSDEGDGIPPAHLRAVFTKFFRPAGERRSGTGLGLYITKGIVEAHAGTIWAAAGQGRGARLHVRLPRGGLELANPALQTRGRRRRPQQDGHALPGEDRFFRA